MTAISAPEVVANAEVRDEDSTIFLERIAEEGGGHSVAVWGTEDVNPTAVLAYTLITEAEFIGFLERAGYSVFRPDGGE